MAIQLLNGKYSIEIDSLVNLMSLVEEGIFGQPFVKWFALCYQTVVCLFCLCMMLVYCGQTVGWSKMPLGREVGPAQATLC